MTKPLELSQQTFIDEAVRDGRYPSAEAVLAEGLRLLQEREAARDALRAKVQAAIALGGDVSDDELDQALDARAAELRLSGIPD